MNVKVKKLFLKMIELFQILKLINKMAFLQSKQESNVVLQA